MPHLRLTISGNERMDPAIAKTMRLGLLATEAIVHIGAVEIRGRAEALRSLADAASAAADMADAYDRDPEAYERTEERRRV